MKYSEMIDFNPIEDVIQLKSADDALKSREYVRSYVMSDKMAATLKAAVIEQLQLDAVESKGVLVVGNYGTGKSHLMSVISTVAHDSETLSLLKNKNFAASMENVAGQFEVLRLEIGGGVTAPLREIIFAEIREDFSKRGISIAKPDFDKIHNNKNLIREIMDAFEKKYPNRGYLLVVDEFFSYLSSRDERQIISDMEFLRELSEMCSKTTLRIIFGVQEKIFDNPRFSFISDTLRHVSDRFTQVVITKDATSYVVSERILKKNPAQKEFIREHLENFCELYENMASRLDDFIDLFPIHPAYIDVFDKIHLIENRHVLKNISLAIKNIFNTDVPTDAPGIISFDDYWQAVKTNIFSKNQETISRVVEASGTLEEIINRNDMKYKPLAIKIIYALSVHRLTTNDLYLKFGLTAENLKNDLCLYLPTPEHTSHFLLGIVREALKDIIKAVSGQFIIRNEDNGQYYIDVDKTIDYDENIRQKATLAPPDELNQYFYKIMLDALQWKKAPCVTNFPIYEHDLIWHSHNIFRAGYLFFGKPEERSTSQTERDFYVLIIPPFGEEYFPKTIPNNEVYFYFKPDDKFKEELGLYYAACELARLSDGKDRATYQGKAKDLQEQLLKRLGEKKVSGFDVVYKGGRRRVADVLRGQSRSDNNLEDILNLVAALCLENHFKKKYPDFPALETKVTRQNKINLTRAAYLYFAGKKTRDSAALLRSFKLLDGEEIRPESSPYAKYFIDLMNTTPTKVINYSDLFEEIDKENIDKRFKIPFDLMPIIFLAMVYGGFAEITLGSDSKLTAGNLEEKLLSKDSSIVSELLEFKYLSRPKDLPLAELRRLFEIIDLDSAQILNPAQRQEAVQKLLDRVKKLRNDATAAENILNRNFELWGEWLVKSDKLSDMKSACKKIRDTFGNYHLRFNTPAKLKNFDLDDAQLDELAKNLQLLELVYEYKEFRANCMEAVAYVSQIENVDSLKDDIDKVQKYFLEQRNNILSGVKSATAAQNVCVEIDKFKARYIEFYMKRHAKNRLNLDEAQRKGNLLSSQTVSNLRTLSDIEILPDTKFKELIDEITALKTCYKLTHEELERYPICQHCHYRLSEPPVDVSEQLERLEILSDEILREWEKILLDALEDPLAQENMHFLNDKQQHVIQKFLADKELPPNVSKLFVESVEALLKDYVAVIIDADDLIRELESLPPLDEKNFRDKLAEFISRLTKDKEPSTVRISLKRH